MKVPCNFVRDGERWACQVCGRLVRLNLPAPPTAVCRGPRGLGDMVADGLAAVGLTKDRAQAVASAVGIKDCGCGKRQAALNAVGKRLGIGVDSPATITGEREADATQAATAEGQAS